jgi:uncharacterized membrane protein YdjX (TVP38/TMEM64 family)
VRRDPVFWLLVAGLAGVVLVAAGWGPCRAGVVEITRLLAAGDLPGVREYLRGFGPWAPLVTFILIQVQAVAAPLPAFPVIYASGLLFGTVWGGLLSWVSVLVSAALCFGLARRWGRPVVERLVNPGALRRTDTLFARHGPIAVLIARLIPFTAFDLLSFAAGLTPMRLGPFLVATAIGMTPAIFLMAWAGDASTELRESVAAMTMGAAALIGGGAWLVARRRGRTAVPATVAEPEGGTGA